MRLLYFKFLLLLSLVHYAQFTYAQPNKHTFLLSNMEFLLDGKPFQMISGEMHCARIPREYWRDRMRKAKAMGLNTIGTYVFWNAHEPEQGVFDFKGNNDIAEFIRIAQQEGLWVVLRPSPYVCAEWEFGGYPYWLLKDKGMVVRSKDPKFLKAYRSYLERLAKELVPRQVTKGGNVLMIQIENEYGAYSDDKEYLDINRKIFREVGFDVELFTCDPEKYYYRGTLPGYLAAINGLDKPTEVKQMVNKYNGGKGPYYIAEWYPGWFDVWGKPHQKRSADEMAERLDKVLAAGISVNMYMFHGGTTRGFMNGANYSDTRPYSPQTSSYDYDAPLDEAGNPTEKFLKFRKVIEKYLSPHTVLPPVPTQKSAIAIPEIKLTAFANLFNNIPLPVQSSSPLTFEDLDQDYGFVLYRTVLQSRGDGILKLQTLHDFATVYLNGKFLTSLDRRLSQDSMQLKAGINDTLDILVENNGRINFGPYLTDNSQGIIGKVVFNGAELRDWKMYSLPFKSVKELRFSKLKSREMKAGFYKAVFDLAKVGDTYLDMSMFGKGFVFLNGHNLGKYWNIGPQQTIYIPSSWFRKKNNELIVFDALKSGHTTIKTINKPLLDEVKNIEIHQ
jgi:beta-galactosidase